MDFELPADDDPRRLAVRGWLAANPSPTGRQLAEAGYVAPHWPKPWGLDADPIHQILIDEERYARLEREAGRTNRSVAAIIREAIDQAFPSDAAEKRRAADAILAAEPMDVPETVEELKRELDEAHDRFS